MSFYLTCPHCGNLCGRLARVCADCAGYLYEPTETDRLERQELIEEGLAALRREDTQTTKGKVT
jgi:hypothetical protein